MLDTFDLAVMKGRALLRAAQAKLDASNPALAADVAAAAQANAAASRAAKLRRTFDDYTAKYPDADKAPPKPAEREPGPKTQEAMLFAQALQRAKEGRIAEASAPAGSGKLEPFHYCGSYGGS